MATRNLIRMGYDFELLRLFTNDTGSGAAAEDLSAATIEISVKNHAKTLELIADVAQANTSPAVWASGLVALRLTAVQTATLTPQVCAWIEVAVVLGGIRIRYEDIPVDIEAGYAL